MANRPTTRQFKGDLNALRASKSHTANQSIDIAGGNYGSGKFFSGVVDISDSSWASATGTFYIYLDENDTLVLDNTSGFPQLSTKIARVVIASGIIIDVIDERAFVNGLVDGYQVLFDDSNVNVAIGDTVQEAIEALDSYVASQSGVAQDITRFRDLDVMGGIQNGLVKICQIDDTPAIEYPNYQSGVSRIRYSSSVPQDYVPGTDIVVKLFWSVGDNSIGDVNWRLRFRTPASGSLINSTTTTVNFQQTTSGTANELIDTGANLFIDSSFVTQNDILIFNIEREHDVNDTYSSSARLHLVRIEYTGRGVI